MIRRPMLTLLLLMLLAPAVWAQVGDAAAEKRAAAEQAAAAEDVDDPKVDLSSPPESGTDYGSLEEAKLRYDRELAYEKAHFERELQALVAKYRQRMAGRQGRHLALLERLKARLARAAKLDAAVEVRDYLTQVREQPPEPLAMVGDDGKGGAGSRTGGVRNVRGLVLGKYTVRSDTDWTRIVEVDAGQKLRITATGQWTYTASEPAVGPEGANRIGPNSLPLGRLVGRVGDDIYDLGAERVIEVRAAGVLEMRGNDSGRDNNAGELEVTVEALP